MPSGSLTYKRGEIWWINLQPVLGNETGKERPCLILQNDIGNAKSSTTIIAPFLPGKKSFPFTVNISPTPQNGLKGERYLNVSQMRAVDAIRVKNKQGVLETQYWQDIEKAVLAELGFGAIFKKV